MMLVRIDDTDWAADTWILGSISQCSQLIVSFKTSPSSNTDKYITITDKYK